jgi:hypothetical protein
MFLGGDIRREFGGDPTISASPSPVNDDVKQVHRRLDTGRRSTNPSGHLKHPAIVVLSLL